MSIAALCLSSIATGEYQSSVSQATGWDRTWLLEEVTYIISDKEKELFESLSTNDERIRFIEAFWEVRDPTPGTVTNEFRTEHYRRIEYAKRTLGEANIPGRRTQMGMVYILFGEPLKKRRFRSSSLAAPAEAWLYPPIKCSGIKYYFHVLFFKRAPREGYQIYKPVAYGPRALIAGSRASDEEALGRLLRIDPLLGQLSLSLLPEEHRPIMLNNSADIRRAITKRTMASEQVLKAMLESRNYMQSKTALKLERAFENRTPVEEAGRYRETEFTGAYQFDVIRDEDGSAKLFYTFEANSSQIAMNEFPGCHCALLHVRVEARNASGSVAAESENYVSAIFAASEIYLNGNVAFSHEGKLDLQPGDYRIHLTASNPIDMRYFEIEEIVSIPRTIESRIRFCSTLLLRGTWDAAEDESGMDTSYRFYGIRYRPNAERILNQGREAKVFYQLYFPRRDRVSSLTVRYSLVSGGRILWSDTETLYSNSLRRGGVFNRTVSLPTRSLPPGDYSFRIAAASLSPPEARAQIDFVIVPKTESRPTPKLAKVER